MHYVSDVEAVDTDELDMAWAIPEYSTEEVDRAGKAFAGLTDPDEFDRALAIINNWRASHYFPLNTFATTLRRKAEHFTRAVVSQRVKRLRAIQHKLQKHTQKPITLSEMQDIGGCRVVLASISQVEKFVKEYEQGDLKHKLFRQDNYIAVPRRSGYRGIHLIYNYLSDRKTTYNGHKIEIQFRTELQHAWATAVEIVGFFRRELLKSSEGDPVWKHFFKLMAAEIAFGEKAVFGIPNIPADRNQVRDQLCRCAARLGACDYLRLIGKGVEDVIEIDIPGAHYFLLELDTSARSLKITGYRLSARQKATLEYTEIERAIMGSEEREAVLVSAQSMADLKRAYINYFLDMRRFIEVAEAATK